MQIGLLACQYFVLLLTNPTCLALNTGKIPSVDDAGCSVLVHELE